MIAAENPGCKHLDVSTRIKIRDELNVILGFAGLVIERGSVGSEIERFAKQIQTAGNNLLRLATDQSPSLEVPSMETSVRDYRNAGQDQATSLRS